jgi:hypothetical protein
VGKKKLRKELKKLRADLRKVERKLDRAHEQLAAVELARVEPGPIEVPTACAPKALLPKTECCGSKDRCRRCPILMLKQGTLPEGMSVKHRKLVGPNGKRITKKQLTKAA